MPWIAPTAKLPAAQLMHAVEAAFGWNSPAGQSLHEVESLLLADTNEPAAHAKQLVDPDILVE